jgi:ABC-type nitrate/sulfonate/bicarbonate transport system substrate-binding protein
MLKKLHDGEADIAITVTDGFIAGRAAGSNVSLIGTYVDSPLTWAVCAAPDSKLNSIEDFMRKENRQIGISRWKSGSHTMSFYLDHLHKLHLPSGSTAALTEGNFKVQGGFESLMAGVQSGSTDIFLWEVFTTKPWFDSGALKYVSLSHLFRLSHFF